MTDPSFAPKSAPEDGDEFAATPPLPEVEEPSPAVDPVTMEAAPTYASAEPLSASVVEPDAGPVAEPPLAPPMAESTAPVMAAPEPPPPPTAPEAAAPPIQPPPTPMPPAGAAPATYAPPTMTTPPPYTPPAYSSSAPSLASSGKSKTTAGILAILLGTLGVHQFYLGKTGWGIGFAVLSIVSCGFGTMLTGPVSIIQGIMYLVATDEDFERKYVQEGKFF